MTGTGQEQPAEARAILAGLFPAAAAAPAPARPRSRGRAAWLAAGYAAAVAAGAGLLLLRQAGTPAWQAMWAEDSWVFLPRALAHPWSSLISPYAQYLQLVPQLIADVVARLPLRDAAAGFAVAGALVASGCAAFAYRASSGHISRPALRALLAVSVLLLPTAIIEIANSGVDAPWYLMFALFWALLWRPASRRGMALAALIAFAAMASNILNLLYLPLVAARLVALPRAREHAVTAGWAAGAAFQVIGLVQSTRPDRIGPVPAALEFYGQHVLVAAVAGWRLALALQAAAGIAACIAVAALLVAAVVTWAVRQDRARIAPLAAASLGMGLLLAIIPALLRYWVPGTPSTSLWVPGSRYTASAILMIDQLAIAGADALLRRRPASLPRARAAVVVTVLVAGLGTGWVTSFRYHNVRSASVPWSREYASYGRVLARQPDRPGGRYPALRLPLAPARSPR
ncbi:MAG TPA: hypothetical protein VH637_14355 [Streptosporangiaceae bacterium]